MRMAHVAGKSEGEPFYATKLKTARFYFRHILPRIKALSDIVAVGADEMMSFSGEEF